MVSPHARGRLQQLLRVDGLAVPVVGEHVGEADERGLALDVVGVVALDRRGEPVRQRPAAGQHAADERVVDAQLEPLLVERAPRACAPRRGSATGSPGTRA